MHCVVKTIDGEVELTFGPFDTHEAAAGFIQELDRELKPNYENYTREESNGDLFYCHERRSDRRLELTIHKLVR